MVVQPINLTLEELASEVAHLLDYYQLLGAVQDSRVSPVPDPRTIRYYTTLGLIDRPRMEGRLAKYGKRQVLQLLAIKALQGHGAPLSDIQSRLLGLNDRQLESLLVSLSQGRQSDDGESNVKKTRVWLEVVDEPGIKLLVDRDWISTVDTAGMAQRIQAALDALKKQGREEE